MSPTMLESLISELRERAGSTIGSLFAAQSLGCIVGSVVGGLMLERFDGHRISSTSMALLTSARLIARFRSGVIG